VTQSYVVTGAARGIGRAISERLSDAGHVVAIDRDQQSLAWTGEHPRVTGVPGDAGSTADAARAADIAEHNGRLVDWVNNAAVFRDASAHEVSPSELIELITLNLGLAVTGCAIAVRRFLARDTPGAIVNVSSHQAQRPVRGALPYAAAKAAIEGLTRALAVDYGPRGIRTNAVALGSIATDRYETLVAQRPEVEAEICALHPLGRAGHLAEVAAVVALLLSPAASYVNGAIVPVDGGRSVLGADPEARGLDC
jgi:NAD(P)-dependent dehydrogenase (short-subunit alcohol dehydrogenase family)